MRARKLLGLLAAGSLTLGLAAAPAGADPTKGDTFPLVCDNGQTYSVISNGNGAFTPAHDLDSTTTFVPVAFGEFTGTITNAGGVVVDSFTEPASSKGQSGKSGKNTVNCTFTFSGTFVENGETFTFAGSGSADVIVTPRK